jgi:hypothetical protein
LIDDLGDETMKNIFSRKRFSVVEVIGLIVVSVLGVSIVVYAATSLKNELHVFEGGKKAVASEVNENFEKVAAQIDELKALIAAGGSGGGSGAAAAPCPDGMALVGPVCVDKYEASIWTNKDGTGTQYGNSSGDFPDTFPQNGNWTQPLYAVSKAGVKPSRFVTWFQAQQSCALSGKRLLTNAEWQIAAAGTPDPGAAGVIGSSTCNTNTSGPDPTGSRADCKSSWGVYDMVGNVWEWVEDTTQGNNSDWNPTGSEEPPPHTLLSDVGAQYGGDAMFGANPATNQLPSGNIFPSVFIRGGHWGDLTKAGVFAQDACSSPSHYDGSIGFRCAVPAR